ncbi:MAG: 3-hydroxyacyl-CoA dehydrogenase NAD-binding domain-containing protein [Rubrivivax sp.]
MVLPNGAPAQVLIDHHGPVVVIRLNRPPVNALSAELAGALKQAIAQAAADPDCRAFVLAGQGRCFSAGADVHGFGASADGPHELPALLESLPKPVVAALHGEVLGAGLELVLACHARVARHDATLGLPEIKLGLIPGAGGTQRLPRLVGEAHARAMMLSGRSLSAQEALDIGLVDEWVPADPVPAACALALELAQGHWQRPQPLRPAAPLAPPGPRTRLPEPASGAIEACLQAARSLPLAEGLALESQWFGQCLRSPDAMALQHAFTAERRARRLPGMPTDLQARPLQRALVVGAGTMGRGIAICLADAGLVVDLAEPDAAARERAQAAIEQRYGALWSRQRLTRTEAAARQGRIRLAPDLGLAPDADLVIEAVFENMALKCGLFAELDRLCRPGALLATNTSSLDVDRIAAATRRPQDVLGLHFFSPAPVMRLLELVRGEHTSWQALADGLALGRRLQKVPVVSRVGPGFIGNRMVGPYGRQAERLLLEGATPEQVDRALQAFGFPMGPHAVGDLVGLDVGVRAAGEAPPRTDERDGAIARRLVAEGRLGQKTGAGLYRYEPGSRVPQPDPEVHALIRDEAQRLGIKPRDIDDAEIVQRCLLALINEGAALLGEGIALRAGDIDTVWLNGYGFPRWMGGPMHRADRMGLPHVLDLLARWQDHCSGDEALWSPAPLLLELACSARSFADWDAEAV